MAQSGKFVAAGEKERLEELITLVENLRLRTRLQANTITNYKPITGYLPKDREHVVSELRAVIKNTSEEEMVEYRNSLNSLGME